MARNSASRINQTAALEKKPVLKTKQHAQDYAPSLPYWQKRLAMLQKYKIYIELPFFSCCP